MKKLLIAALMVVGVFSTPAGAFDKQSLGSTVALINVADKLCGTSEADREVVMDMVLMMTQIMHWDMWEIQQIADNSWSAHSRYMIDTNPAAVRALAEARGTCLQVYDTIETARDMEAARRALANQ